jgi:superfamily II DNA or RNA helicase
MVGKFCGYQKDEDQAIIVSTWQSVYTKPKFLRKFTVLICDEAHNLRAEIIRGVAEKAINCKYRLGFTGTVPDQKSDRLLIEGVLGPIVDQVLPDELIRLKTISDIKITIIKLLYPDSRVKMMEDQAYQLEKEFAETDKFRNAIICKLAKGITDTGKNCLVLVKKIDHGETLVKMLKDECCNVEFISGDTKIKDRNEVRHDVEDTGGQIIVATVGVYSTGVSINRLHSVIFAAAGKSKIQTLQSVGRGLRLHPTKDKLYLYDISENLNFSEKHLKKRLQYYEMNKFTIQQKEVIVKCLD